MLGLRIHCAKRFPRVMNLLAIAIRGDAIHCFTGRAELLSLMLPLFTLILQLALQNRL